MPSPDEQKEIRSMLQRNMVTSLWHFTDIRNLPTIRTLNGLKSKEYLENYGKRVWESIFLGGDTLSHELDLSLGNWDKISLNFKPHTNIAYRKKREKHLVFIEIDPEVAIANDAYFTDCNAARTRDKQQRERGIRGLRNVNFDVINGPAMPRSQTWQKYVQAEVLIPHEIQIGSFKAIHFISDASREYGESLWGKKCDLFRVSPGIFYDYSKGGTGALEFPYVKETYVSNRVIPKSQVNAIRTNSPCVVVGEPFWVIVHLYITTGARVSISLENLKKREDYKSPKDSDGIFCHRFTVTENLKWLVVKVYIDEILWTSHRVLCEEMSQ